MTSRLKPATGAPFITWYLSEGRTRGPLLEAWDEEAKRNPREDVLVLWLLLRKLLEATDWEVVEEELLDSSPVATPLASMPSFSRRNNDTSLTPPASRSHACRSSMLALGCSDGSLVSRTMWNSAPGTRSLAAGPLGKGPSLVAVAAEAGGPHKRMARNGLCGKASGDTP